jgi:hypothetical protein
VWSINDHFDQVKNSEWITRANATINYLVVAGGGGGQGDAGGAGGAGGYRASGFGPSPLRGSALSLLSGSYTVTVGGGGSAVPSATPACGSGSVSTFSTITSAGGGSGVKAGGSGGGGRFAVAAGAGNTPPTDPPPVSSPVSAPNPSPVVPPPVTSAPSPDEGDDEAGDDDEDEDDYYFPCEDSPLDMVLNIGRRNCDWVAENRDRCERAALASHCPVTCDVCDQCSDSRKRFVLEDGRRKKCSYFERNPDQCEEQSGVTETCRDACGFCGE